MVRRLYIRRDVALLVEESDGAADEGHAVGGKQK